MTARSFARLIVIAAFGLSASACKASFTTANLKDVHLALDEEGEQNVTSFGPSDTFYVVGKLNNAPPDTTLKAVWTAVDVEGEDAGKVLGEKEVPDASGEFHFSLENEQRWPDGDYKVDLWIGDKVAQSIDFTVGERAAGKPERSGKPKEGGVGALNDVKKATIQIVAEGSFVDPEVGEQLNAAGAGSGFFIDPSGIAVTNNHVVTGAALLKVYVYGDSEPKNAKVLGVSECSDLAVIDVEGDGYPFLDWYDGAPEAGLDVYAAGFPLGEPEFTLTRGIVSKEKADGDTTWASIDHVLQHDADINPGNSGGPLVSGDGQVVGVNYATGAANGQYFAIARAEAMDVIDKLQAGEDINSLGINGTAVNDGESLSGIWVSSVASGSPADEVGIKGGDIVTKLENLVLATDGSMADYCDILRGHDPGDKLKVEVLRFQSQEVMEGQLNGRELEQSFSFAQELGDEVQAQPTGEAGEAGTAGYAEYVTVNDDSGAIAMKVPSEWNDVDGSAWVKDEEQLGVSIMASSDRAQFVKSYDVPGVFFGASKSYATKYDPAGLLDFLKPDSGVGPCTFQGREDYEDPFYKGAFDSYTDCGGEDAGIVMVAAVPEDKAFILFLLIQVVTEADLQALDQIIDTFQVVGELP